MERDCHLNGKLSEKQNIKTTYQHKEHNNNSMHHSISPDINSILNHSANSLHPNTKHIPKSSEHQQTAIYATIADKVVHLPLSRKSLLAISTKCQLDPRAHTGQHQEWLLVHQHCLKQFDNNINECVCVCVYVQYRFI